MQKKQARGPDSIEFCLLSPARLIPTEEVNLDSVDALQAKILFIITGLTGSTRVIGLFAALYFTWDALLGGTTPVLLSLVSAATRSESQGSVLGVAQTCQQGAPVVGTIAGVTATQHFGFEAAFPLVSGLNGLSFFVELGLWLKSRQSLR